MYVRTKLFQKRGHYSRGDTIQGGEGHYLRKYGMLKTFLFSIYIFCTVRTQDNRSSVS